MKSQEYNSPQCKVVQLDTESVLCSSIDTTYLQSYKYCSKCKKPIAAAYDYCPHCGKKQ